MQKGDRVKNIKDGKIGLLTAAEPIVDFLGGG